MDKQEILNILFQLYRLRDEGKNVEVLIEEMEDKLFEIVEEVKDVR